MLHLWSRVKSSMTIKAALQLWNLRNLKREKNIGIAIKYHHFKNFIDDKVIKISYIDTKKQLSDMVTKFIEANKFFKLRFMLMGW